MKLFRVVGVALLVVLCGIQWWSLRTLRTQFASLQTRTAGEMGRLARMQFSEERRNELRRAVTWLDTFEHASEGLGRPGGVCVDNHVDMASVDWLLDPYLRSRVGGDSEEAARQQIVEIIKSSPEWRLKHPPTP
jgi:hypothetical protein